MEKRDDLTNRFNTLFAKPLDEKIINASGIYEVLYDYYLLNVETLTSNNSYDFRTDKDLLSLNEILLESKDEFKDIISNWGKYSEEKLNRLLLETIFGSVSKEEYKKILTEVINYARSPKIFLEHYKKTIIDTLGENFFQTVYRDYLLSESRRVIIKAPKYSYNYVKEILPRYGFKKRFMELVKEFDSYKESIVNEINTLTHANFDNEACLNSLDNMTSSMIHIQEMLKDVRNVYAYGLNRETIDTNEYTEDGRYSLDYLEYIDESTSLKTILEKLDKLSDKKEISEKKYKALAKADKIIYPFGHECLMIAAFILGLHLADFFIGNFEYTTEGYSHLKKFAIYCLFSLYLALLNGGLGFIVLDGIYKPIENEYENQKNIKALKKNLSDQLDTLNDIFS